MLFFCCKQEDKISVDIYDEIIIPKNYVVHKTSSEIIIDGKDDENDWKNTEFTTSFVDIEATKTPKQDTKVKMLWNKDFLYIYAKLEEKHIWGNIKDRDEIIFLNNDFEVFIDPSNDTHNYGEIEINTLNTIWDLLLNKPYIYGGKAITSWDLTKLKSAVFIKGTLNDFSDEDDFWSVEIAIPLKPLIVLKNISKKVPVEGEQWRINFSRVQWDYEIINNKYAKKKINNKLLPEYNWVWSNQKTINMHIPENWGYIQFSEKSASKKVAFLAKTNIIAEQISYALFREINLGELKYLKEKEAGFITTFNTLKYDTVSIKASFLKTFAGFTILTKNEKQDREYIIKEDGVIIRK